MRGRSDNAVERQIHDDNRAELRLLQGGEAFVQSIFELQHHARDTEYARSFGNALYYMIEKAGDTIGRLVLDFDEEGIRIVDLALLTHSQGQGIGTTVIRAMQSVASRLSAPLILTVRLDNPNAIRLYLALGFVADAPSEVSNLHFQMRWRPAPGPISPA